MMTQADCSGDYREAIDSIDRAIDSAAFVIRGLRLGVSGRVSVEGSPGMYLLFDFFNGAQMRSLYIELRGDDGTPKYRSLLKLSVMDRKLMALNIPSLVEDMRARRPLKIAGLQKAANELDDYLAELSEPQNPNCTGD